MQVIRKYEKIDEVWMPDVVGRAYGNRGNARSRQVTPNIVPVARLTHGQRVSVDCWGLWWSICVIGPIRHPVLVATQILDDEWDH